MENTFVKFRIPEVDGYQTSHYGCLIKKDGEDVGMICFDNGKTINPGKYEILEELSWDQCNMSLKHQIDTPKIFIPLGERKAIVAETNWWDPDYSKEMYVYLEKDGSCYQDLAVIRQSYKYDDEHEGPVYMDKQYTVLVYADENSSDYTDPPYNINERSDLEEDE